MTLPLEASLQGLRESLFLRCDHSPTASAAVHTAANNFINQAIQRLALDMPYACHEEYIRFSTDYPVASIGSTDTMSLVTVADGDAAVIDEYTLKRAIVSGQQVIPFDRSFDGAFIELTDARGVVHTNQIKSVWLENDTTDYWFISLVRPLISRQDRSTYNLIADDGPFTYRIFHPFAWLSDEIIQIKEMHVVGRGEGSIAVISQDEAEQRGLVDYNYSQTSGVPCYAYRRGHFQLPSPNVAPTVGTSTSVSSSKKWRGPEPYGSFEYCYTLTWGKRDYDHGSATKGSYKSGAVTEAFLEYESDFSYATNANVEAAYWIENRRREPLFESAPSPASSTITVTDPGTNNQADAVALTFPNLQYQLGHMFTGTNTSGAFTRLADAHSGVHIRIYRRRLTTSIGAGYATLHTETDSQRINSLKMLDEDDAFHLLAEFRIDAANEGRFFDDGYILPDRTRRLRDIHGYQGVRLHPTPDARYEIEARVVKRPPMLINDTDRPQIDPACNEAIVLYAASLNYERMKDPMSAQRMLGLYRDALNVIGRRYSDMRPPTRAGQMRPAGRRQNYRGGLRAGNIE